jgi:hypothetical protein
MDNVDGEKGLDIVFSTERLHASRRTASSGMLHRVALVRKDVSEGLRASIRVTRIGELGTTLAVTSNRSLAWYFFAACLS